MALRTGRGGRDVVRGLGSGTDVTCEGGRGRMTAAAVTRGWGVLVERCRGTRVAGGGVRAGDHAEERRRLVALLAARDRGGDGGVAGHTEGRRVDVRVAELEAADVEVGRRVATRAVT